MDRKLNTLLFHKKNKTKQQNLIMGKLLLYKKITALEDVVLLENNHLRGAKVTDECLSGPL